MKKIVITMAITICCLACMAQLGWLEIFGVHRVYFERKREETKKTDSYDFVSDKLSNTKYRVKAEDDYFYIFENGNWKQVFWVGVNIGAGEPALFPGDLTISYETYYRWFKYISEMNCNCIRIYTLHSPQFYKALFDFNEQSDNPLYLFQGVWMNEEDIDRLSDVYAENQKILNDFKQTLFNTVDVIHGNITIPEAPGLASGAYTTDISKWLAGWIVGIEWEPDFVKNTNDINVGRNVFDGKYLYTQAASPFEAFLCESGNDMIEYETDNYSFQAPLAFTNWITTDPLTHADEPHYDEDSVTVNTENIKSRNSFVTNMFVSYHIYPYYPDSLNYQQDYLKYIDNSGKINPYEAYLKDLKMAHTLPIVVSEFGIPTSRGLGHESVMGYNQGGVDETDQGTMLLDMFNSIQKENYAGGIVFSWQDEWFKRTWNNVNFDVPDRRPFWSNIQTTEQCFGIMTFDPGETQSVCYVDGDIKEWAGMTPVATNKDTKLYMKSDERYVYLMVNAPYLDFEKDSLLIPIDTISDQGNNFMSETNVTFDAFADFVIWIRGEEGSRIVVDPYYDAFTFLYGEQYKMFEVDPNIGMKNSGNFNKMNMCFGYELIVPTTKEIVPFKSYETGFLKFGNANPSSENYLSLADFCYADGKLEIKIPWQLLNVMDPSQKQIMDDFRVTQIFSPKSMEYIKVGVGIKEATDNSVYIPLSGLYDFTAWELPTFHERLKPSYYELQEGLLKFNEK